MSLYLIKAENELALLEPLQEAKVLGLDIETAGENGLDPLRSRIRLVQLAVDEDVYVIDLDRLNARDALMPLLTDPKILKVIHNAKFEVKHFLHHFHIVVQPVFCTFLASKLLAMGQPQRHGLGDVTERYLGRTMDKSLQQSDFGGALTEEQVHYAAEDAVVLPALHKTMRERLIREKLKKVAQLEFRTVTPVAAMELRGIWVDIARLTTVEQRFIQERDALEADVLTELQAVDALPGMNTLNLNAPDQVKEALAARGIEVQDTGEAQLRQLADTYPFIQKLLSYRHLQKIIGSGLQQLKNHVSPVSGRVHSSYHQIASASGRFACSEPNIQQVPREPQVRECVRPADGYAFIVADYSQVELRVAAALSQDPIMLDAYAKGQDLHRLTAALTMGKDIEAVTKEERQAAKAINFGLIYAMGARGLQQSAKASYGVELSLEEATTFRNRYFQNYAGIARWQRQMEQSGSKRRYVRTAAGRIRAYHNEQIRVTELLNTPVQGTAAEGLKSAMCIFWDEVRAADLEAWIVAIIHDEIIVEVRQDQAQQVKTLLEQSMVRGIAWLAPSVSFEVEGAVTDSWAGK